MKPVIAVLRGGPSHEYEVSLQTGAHVLEHLPDHYEKKDILISRDGAWHVNGFTVVPQKALEGVSLAWNAMHGEYGEDGKVQKLLEDLHVPFTGSSALSSALAINKHIAKDIYRSAGIVTPAHVLIESTPYLEDVEREAKRIFLEFHMPVVVKPVGQGSSVGVRIAQSFKELVSAISHACGFGKKVIVEQYIFGREATCAVIDGFRGEEHYTPFVVEIVHPKGRHIFDYDAKYGGETQEICPAKFPENVLHDIAHMSRKAHKSLGLRHYSRSDFRITPHGRVYILETNSLPGLTKESLLPKSLNAIGCPFPHFLEHVISLVAAGK